MNLCKIKIASVGAICTSFLVLGFQNCSGTQFTAAETEALNLKRVSSTEMNSSEPTSSSAKIDLVTPRIVLSDQYDGEAKPSFSPKKIVYGTVYGLSDKNVHVCMGSNYGCEYWPGYRQAMSTVAHYSKPVEQLPNWRYQVSDRTWRFTLDYSEVGDVLDKVVVHEMVPDSETDFVFFNGPGAGVRLRLEAMVSVRSELHDAGIYFNAWGRDTVSSVTQDSYGSKIFTRNSGLSSLNQTFSHIAGLGPNVGVCHEKVGSGRCSSVNNYMPAQNLGRYSTVRGLWQINNSGLKLDSLGAVGGKYAMYARDASTGTTVSSEFYLNPPSIRCYYASTTPVLGPCSDPETSQNQCTQSNVGQTLQGTGSCKAKYTCTCTSS